MNLIPIKYTLSLNPDKAGYRIYIEYRGENKYAITNDWGDVFSRAGQWKYEPSPSNRTDEFIAATRYDSAAEALDIFTQFNEEK